MKRLTVHRFLARRSAAAAALVCATFVTSNAAAFCRTTTCNVRGAPSYCARDTNTGCWLIGAPLFWEQGCVSFSVQWNGSQNLNLSYTEAETIVGEAFALWVTTLCPSLSGFESPPSIAVSSAGPTWCMKKEFNPEGPNSNAVLFVDQGWSGDPSALAVTTVSFNSTTGRIYGADLEVNSEGWQLTPTELAYVLTHEAGHYLGLDHSFEPGALMNPTYDRSGSAVELSTDDVAAICAAYEPSRTTPECNFEPDDGYSGDCGGDVEAGCVIAGPPKRSALAGGALATLFAAALLRRRGRGRGARGWRRSA